MSLINYNKSLLELRLASQQREEDLLRRQAQRDAAQQQSTLSLIPQLTKGFLQAGEMGLDYQEAENKRMLDLARASTAGDQVAQPERRIPFSPIVGSSDPSQAQATPVQPAPSALPAIPAEDDMPEGDVKVSDLGIVPALKQMFPDGNATVDPNIMGDPFKSGINPALEKQFNTPAQPALPSDQITDQNKATLAPIVERINTLQPAAPEAIKGGPAPERRLPVTAGQKPPEEQVEKKELSSVYTPIKYNRSVADEAKAQVEESLQAGEPNLFLNILTLGSAQGKYNQARVLAEKIARKSITEERNKEEAVGFDRWAKQQQLAADQRRLAADEELKAAQAAKARQATTGVLRLTGDGRKDMQTATGALRVTKDVEESFKSLVRKGGPGFVSGIPKEYLTAFVLGAGANTDSSTAGVQGSTAGARGALGAFGGALQSSTGASYGVGGAYIDPKVATEAIEYFDKLNMAPEQRDFLMKTRQAAQQLGKIRENGRMTDADLRFYLENLLNMDSPQAFASSLTSAKDKVLESYKEMYYTYAPSNKDLEKAFASPESFMSGSLLDPTTLGYKDNMEMATMLDQYRFKTAADLGQQSKRVTQIKQNLKKSPSEVGQAGYGRSVSVSDVAKQGYEGSKDVAQQVGSDIAPKPKRTPRGLR